MDKLLDLILIGGLTYMGYVYYQQLNQEQQGLIPTTDIRPPTQQQLEEEKRNKEIQEIVNKIKQLKSSIAMMAPIRSIFGADFGKAQAELEKYKALYEQLTGVPFERETPKFNLLPVNREELKLKPVKDIVYATM